MMPFLCLIGGAVIATWLVRLPRIRLATSIVVLCVATQAAFNFRVQNGYPYSPIAVLRLPNAGTQNVFVTDLDNNRSESVPIFDIRVDKSFQMRGLEVTGIFDAYNLFNNNAVTNAFLTSGSTYDRVIAALDPRALQVALRFKF